MEADLMLFLNLKFKNMENQKKGIKVEEGMVKTAEQDFNKQILESIDFLLFIVKRDADGDFGIRVHMKSDESIVRIITTILREDDEIRQDVLSNLIADQLHKSNDKTIN